jgi:hypothetical protein
VSFPCSVLTNPKASFSSLSCASVITTSAFAYALCPFRDGS